VEQQAFGRIFRIGQEKETHFARLVARKTVDMRMLHLQAYKIKQVDEAMQDTGKVTQPLSLLELVSLFGTVYQENGKYRVGPDYDDDEEDGGSVVADEEDQADEVDDGETK
jgi:hypothetical protein